MKPPESVPAEIEHDDEAKRPPGEEDRTHEVPAKFDPEAATTVPTGPEPGVNVKVRPPGALNVAVLASPEFPVTVTEYAPLAPDGTVNDPDTTPPAPTVQIAFETRSDGDDEIVQDVSLEEKCVPDTRTVVPAPPELGFNVVVGTTVKLAVPTSRPGCPVSVTG